MRLLSGKRLRSPENAQLICRRVVEGFTLRQIAKELGCTSGAISIWCAESADFAKQYAHAKELQADRMAEEILEIADDGTNDWQERQVGEGETISVPDHEHINRSRLRIDARKWLMSKMLPKKYGDKLVMSGDPNNPIRHEHVIERDRAIVDALFAEVAAEEKRTTH